MYDLTTTMKKLLLIMILISCQKPDLHCYECESSIMASWTVSGTTEAEMQATIRERIRITGDTLRCEKIMCE